MRSQSRKARTAGGIKIRSVKEGLALLIALALIVAFAAIREKIGGDKPAEAQKEQPRIERQSANEPRADAQPSAAKPPRMDSSGAEQTQRIEELAKVNTKAKKKKSAKAKTKAAKAVSPKASEAVATVTEKTVATVAQEEAAPKIAETFEKAEKTAAAATAAREIEPEKWTPGYLTTSGTVYKLLPDDMEPPCHQRFLIRTPSGRGLLVAHNIDCAPYIETLAVGDKVTIHGEFIDNDRGGLIHWTHSPKGWIKHGGVVYK